MWLQGLVAKFGPVTERADNTTVLDFERPLAELDSRIREVRSFKFCFFRVELRVLCASEGRSVGLAGRHWTRCVVFTRWKWG